jgi:hypothetical protein
MTTQQFYDRLILERTRFLTICQQVGVWREVERDKPRLAPAFAEGLILDMSEAQARLRIRSDPEGAAAVVELVANLLDEQTNKDTLAAGMPSENLTPFYLLSSLVIDAAHQDWDVLQKLNSDTTDLDAPPSVS